MMNGREIIKDIMSRFNITNATLANRLGITPAALWDRKTKERYTCIPLVRNGTSDGL